MKKNNLTYQELSDEDLILAYKKSQDKAYIGELFNRYGAVVYGVCLKYLKNVAESQDMSMQIFEKLMVLLLDKSVLNFRSWLHVVSRNECLMLLRKQGKTWHESVDEKHHLQSDESSLELKQLEEIQLSQLEAAILQLKPDQRTCIDLFYIKEKCYQEVADQTGFSLKQVKSFIQNGKRNLKNILITQTAFTSTIPNRHE